MFLISIPGLQKVLFEGNKCLFSTYSYTFLRGSLQFIPVVVRGGKIYFAALSIPIFSQIHTDPYPKYRLKMLLFFV